ncbi:hypothetical protein M5D96_007170, partial [Drosophila gunungcola]
VRFKFQAVFLVESAVDVAVEGAVAACVAVDVRSILLLPSRRAFGGQAKRRQAHTHTNKIGKGETKITTRTAAAATEARTTIKSNWKLKIKSTVLALFQAQSVFPAVFQIELKCKRKLNTKISLK